MYKKSMIWRRTTGADTLIKTYQKPEILEKYFPVSFVGIDKQGNPILFNHSGITDFRGLFDSVTKVEFIKYMTYLAELGRKLCNEQSKQMEKFIGQISVVINGEGFSRHNMTKKLIDYMTEFLKVFEANYPEYLYKFYILNPPKIFKLLYNIVKPFLKKATRDKVIFLGNDYKAKLAIDFHIENALDTFCIGEGSSSNKKSKSDYIVPDEYKMNNENISDVNSEIKIGRFGEVEVDFLVEKSNSIVRYSFQTNDKIKFGVYKKTDNSQVKYDKMKKIEALHSVESHKYPEDGCFECEEEGIYTIVWSNKTCLIGKNRINYTLDVLLPNCDTDSGQNIISKPAKCIAIRGAHSAKLKQ
ncbi:DgyrCDS10749 [Dimorphilus gyrociliatus]|nr:DgyrCDS10749 [Dimorphilus gyrociliatus]